MAAIDSFAGALAADLVDAIERFLAPQFYGSVPGPDEPSATERVRGIAEDLVDALPNLEASLQDIVATDSGWEATLTLRGSHTRPLWGAPGSGYRIEWSSPVSIRDIDGKFAVRLADSAIEGGVAALRGMGLVNAEDEMHLPTRHPVSIPEFVMKLLFTGQAADLPCSHLDLIAVTEPTSWACKPCFEEGTIWPSLRMCMVCGSVGCCDTSTNQHAKGHVTATGHPIIRSVRLDERWAWCYEDGAFFEGSTIDRFVTERRGDAPG